MCIHICIYIYIYIYIVYSYVNQPMSTKLMSQLPRILWNSMTNALAKGAQWLRALSVASVVTADVVTLGAALQALEQGGAQRGQKMGRKS